MKSIIKLASVAVFGVMAMAVTGSVKPLSVGLVSEAKAGLSECKSRCQDKNSSCDRKCRDGKPYSCILECNNEQRECEKDCEANAK